MDIIYKQDFYNTKESFLGYLVPVMDDLDHPAFIEEWRKNLDPAAYEKKPTMTVIDFYHSLSCL